MQIQHNAQVYMYPTHGLFAYRMQPQYKAQWYPWEFGDGSLVNEYGGTDNVSHNYNGQFTTSTPLRVPHNSFLTSGEDTFYDSELALATSAGAYDTGLPSLTWSSSTETGCKYIPNWGGQSDRSLGITAQTTNYSSASSNAFYLSTPTGDHQALICTLSMRPQPVVSLASGAWGGNTSATTPPSLFIGVTQGTYWWKVVSDCNGDYEIMLSMNSGSSWVTLKQIPRTSSTQPGGITFNSGLSEQLLDVEFRLLSNRMYIRLNDKSEEFNFIANFLDGDGNPITLLTNMFCGGTTFMAVSIWGECLKWNKDISLATPYHSAPYASMTYSDISLDVAPGSGPGWSYALDTSTVDPGTGQKYTQTDGPDLRSKLNLTGPSDGTYLGTAYSNVTAIIRSFYTDSDGYDLYIPSSPTTVQPERIIVNHKFDPESLTIRSVAKLYFNNYNSYWGNWMLNNGQQAIQIYMSRTQDNGIMSAPILVFTGYAHTMGEVESVEGGSTYCLTCEDRLISLDTPRWDLPRMDGWNQFYAASYLAQIGGWSPDDMYFNYLVPPTQFDDNGDQFGNPAPFLPIGDSGSLQNRYANGKLLDLLIKQANPIGYMVFQDVTGQLHFEKFQLPAGVKRVFSDSDWESSGGTESVIYSKVSKNMKQVRSDMAVIGVNSYSPYWNPIIERRPTDPSTNPIVFDTTAWNHLGYQNIAEWVDGIFANEAFAANAADYMFTVFSLPGLDVQLPTAWLQPDIFPLDVIVYSGDRVPIGEVPIMVTEVTHDMTIGRATSSIIARYVPGSPSV